jgi:hypothetical protein
MERRTLRQRRGGGLKMAAIHAACPTLLGDVSRLAKSNDDFLSVLDSLVRHAGNISDGGRRRLRRLAVPRLSGSSRFASVAVSVLDCFH